MLRVAVDATPLIGHKTGVGVFAANVVADLARRPDVELTAYGVTWRSRGMLAGVVPPGVRRPSVPMSAGPLHAAWARRDWPVIERWTGPVDVVHGTDFVVPPARRAAQVVTVHDLTCVRFPQLCAPVSLRFPGLIRRALARGAFVHTHSEAIAAEVVELLGARPERVRTVPAGVSAPPLARAGPGPSGLRAGQRYVLALGNVEPRKDLPSLVAAFDAVAAGRPDVDLVIAGPPGWGEEALQGAIDAASCRERIRRLGWVDDGVRSALLRGAAVFAYPSIYEGFGLPPLEAMAAGVPVVATATGAVPGVLGDAAKLVPVGDRDALGQAIAELLDDPEERARLVQAGKDRAARFSWERCAAGIVELYHDALASRRS